ncbi:hypothetical protein HYC85_017733 [Camellia sinensis]|uniref:Carbonic anhydrase n=1 Tax=Camellia sinensis TaxID=4442 RepID=A0A7J7GVV7_CAMSI|nr:hypothetical protein HYC85_017733 [Camellia sinensis]
MAQAFLGFSSLSPLSYKSFSSDLPGISASPSIIFGTQLKLVEIEQTHLSLPISFKSNSVLRLKASMEPPGLTQELTNSKQESIIGTQNGSDLFNEMKHRENLECYENLAKSQAPKPSGDYIGNLPQFCAEVVKIFLTDSCKNNSRVCPSYILGFQPGEAFVVRNVANLVPPFENGPTETNAALEFAVNSLEESINRSLMSLLTYPWIHERVTKGKLSIHGGYYNFVDCTFEKWTLDYEQSSLREESGKYSLKNREFWS